MNAPTLRSILILLTTSFTVAEEQPPASDPIAQEVRIVDHTRDKVESPLIVKDPVAIAICSGKSEADVKATAVGSYIGPEKQCRRH